MSELQRILAENFECYISKRYRDIHSKNALQLLKGGQLRKFSGSTQEEAMNRLISDTCYLNGLTDDDFSLVKGDIKGNGVTVSNPGGDVTVGVDWHLYIRGKLVLINECKSYLDAAFLARAHAYMSKIKSYKGNSEVKSMVTSLERAIDINTYNYYMYGDVIDRCYFFTAGTRTSFKPMYIKKYWKNLNMYTIANMIKFIDDTVKESLTLNASTK